MNSTFACEACIAPLCCVRARCKHRRRSSCKTCATRWPWGASHYAALPSELTELRWLVKKMIDELALRDRAAPQLHPECCHQKGCGGRGTRPAAVRDGSFAHQAAAQPAGHCFAPKRPCWSTLAAALHIANTGRGLVVEAVWPGTAF